jgi:myo-inositol-hexaphosphate 3-phosphohydrolase
MPSGVCTVLKGGNSFSCGICSSGRASYSVKTRCGGNACLYTYEVTPDAAFRIQRIDDKDGVDNRFADGGNIKLSFSIISASCKASAVRNTDLAP